MTYIFSVALVAMVGVSKKAGNRSESRCVDRVGAEAEGAEVSVEAEAEFGWSTRQQQLLLGSYYWGYTAATLPAAWLATKLGFRGSGSKRYASASMCRYLLNYAIFYLNQFGFCHHY